MNKKKIGFLMFMAGLILFIFILILDLIGIGDPGFGVDQVAGLCIAVVIGGGGILLRGEREQSEPAD